jgi:hypothetical protein
MPPRYAYWTIIAGGLPTAFRAAEREELLPTFQRIREKHPDAQMKWFARGKLWESPEAARVRHDEGRGRRPFGDTRVGARHDDAGSVTEKRSRDWRPGGEHRDPRQKFVDAKKQKNAALRKDRWDRKNTTGVRGQGSGAKAVSGYRPEGNRPEGSRPEGKRPQWNKRDRKPFRGQDTEEPQQPPRPPGPNREPRRNETPKPAPPPHPDEPKVPAPGPSERGHIKHRRPFQPRGGFPKRPRRP